jgi:molecular chaperone GrpE
MSPDVNDDIDERAATDAADAPAGSHELPAPDELAKALGECEGLRDRLLRTTAEFDNYRKRVERERRETIERAAEGVLLEILPIVDDLERALAAEASGEGTDAYRRGVELIYKQLTDLLARRGVTPIEAVGQIFDPHLHQAVASEPHPDRRDGEIVEELRRGYRLGDRLLRPAMVKVAQA